MCIYSHVTHEWVIPQMCTRWNSPVYMRRMRIWSVCDKHVCVSAMCEPVQRQQLYVYVYTGWRRLIYICGMTHSCVTWLIYVWSAHSCVTWLVRVCDTLPVSCGRCRCIHIWHDAFICMIWQVVFMCDMTHLCVRHDSFKRDVTHSCVTWPIHVRDTTLCVMWQALTHSHVTWRVHICVTTHPHAWHDSFTCVAIDTTHL